MHLYWNWYDAIGFVTLSLIQCNYVLTCRVIICLDTRFMNVRPQVPPTFTRTNAVLFLSYPLNFSKTFVKLPKRFLKQVSCAKCQPFFFGRNALVAGECNSVTLVFCMRAVGSRATTSRHCVYLDWNFVMWEEFHWRYLIYCLMWVLLVNILQLSFVYKVCTVYMT